MSPEAIADIITENKLLKDENEDLKNRLAWLTRQIFGAKSERFVADDDAQTTLDLGITASCGEQATETICYDRKKTARHTPHGREEIPAHLPRREMVFVPNDVDLTTAERIGEKVTERVEYKPAEYYVKRIIRPVFAVMIDGVRTLVCAQLPKHCNDKGKYGASFIAHAIVDKFEDHTPIYRQQKQIMRDSGLDIPETTLDRLPEIAAFWLEPIARRLAAIVMGSGYIQMDESTLRVMIQPTKGKSSTGHIWLRHAPEHNIVVFDYDRRRNADTARRLVAEYQGILQTDGYVVYDAYSATPGILHVGCHAHGRRGFEKSKDNDRPRATHALGVFRKLFEIEAEARQLSLSAEQRLELRQERAAPIMDSFKAWLEGEALSVRPKSLIGKAIGYCLNQWLELSNYLKDGRVEISNNLIENCVRPFALGRKNWLFAGSEDAASRMATLFTIIGTCKLLGVNTFEYITHVLEEIPKRDSKDIEDLLPTNWKPYQTN